MGLPTPPQVDDAAPGTAGRLALAVAIIIGSLAAIVPTLAWLWAVSASFTGLCAAEALEQTGGSTRTSSHPRTGSAWASTAPSCCGARRASSRSVGTPGGPSSG